LEPIPETEEALERLIDQGDTNLPANLVTLGERVKQIAPDCVGVSLTLAEESLTFTLVATSDEIAILDASQYLDDGPCIAAVQEEGWEVAESDIMDETRWQVFAQACAAPGVASTLSLPVAYDAVVMGSVNLYGGTADAFAGLADPLAKAVGAEAEAAVSNADLAFSTREEAAKAPGRLDELADIDVAVGIVVSVLGLNPQEARRRLRGAATRAGVAEAQLARALIVLMGS
jgi:hypothetical protein